MFRYIAFSWNDRSQAECNAVRILTRRTLLGFAGWRTGLDVPGMRVFYAGSRPGYGDIHELAEGCGVLLGVVFENGSCLKRSPFGVQESARIVATGGAHLTRTYWGRYVAFLHEPHTRVKRVIRDPAGGLPCFHTTFQGVIVFFSLAEDLAELGLVPFHVNWDFMRCRVVTPMQHGVETALSGTFSLVPGGCMVVDAENHAATHSLWDPVALTKEDPIEEPGEAAKRLYATTSACVHAWASCHDAVLHKLSGGLDSSIVLASLRSAPSRPSVTCLNYYSPGCDGDEREYARPAAARTGYHLIEQARNPDLSLAPMLRLLRTPTPSFSVLSMAFNRAEADLARDLGCSAIFSGNGGDQLFYQYYAGLGVADYVHHHGFGPQLLDLSLDAAHLEHTSIWRVLARAIRYGLLRAKWDPREMAFHARQLVAPDLVDAVRRERRYLHPSLEREAYIPPGKRWHLSTLCTPPPFYDPAGSPMDADRLAPLLSQPLIELCLRIPSFVLTTGGWDRAIARRAFAHEVPSGNIRRRTKGGMEEYVKEVLMRNLPLIREILLDGALCRARLLDRRALEVVLSGSQHRIASNQVELFDYLGIEVWLRAWDTAKERVAA